MGLELKYGTTTEKVTLTERPVKEGFPVKKEEYEANIPLTIPAAMDLQPTVSHAQLISVSYYLSAELVVSHASNIKVFFSLHISFHANIDARHTYCL